MPEKYIALVPAYQPGPVFVDLLSQLREEGFEIIVVNDGSGPEYTPLFEKASDYAVVLTHGANAGKGAALKTGFSYIRSVCNGSERIIVTVDADGQHRAKDAKKVCDMARRCPDALILGSRQLQQNVPLRSRFGNTVTRMVFRLSTGSKIRDTQTGLRAFSSGMLPELLEIPGSRYEYEMNVLLKFAQAKRPVQEETIDTVYIDNNAASHFNTLWDSCRIYREILKFSGSSFVGFLVDYAMYSLLLLVTSHLLLSNIGARVVSAAVNYNLNRRYVFRAGHAGTKSALQYFLLAAAILLGNTVVLHFLVNICGINRMLAKMLTEVLFFTVSWLVQRCLIFPQQKQLRRHGGRTSDAS